MKSEQNVGSIQEFCLGKTRGASHELLKNLTFNKSINIFFHFFQAIDNS